MGTILSCLSCTCLDEKGERQPAYKIVWDDTMSDIRIYNKNRTLKKEMEIRKKQRDAKIENLPKHKISN